MRDEIEFLTALRGHVLSESRKNLLAFICAMNKSYKINWHNKAICSRLSRLAYEKQKNIMIFLPPQTGKSEIVSRTFPAWLLGINPNLRIILASYSADLATGFCRDVQKILLSPDYEEIFPNTQINDKRVIGSHGWKRTANFFEVIDTKGYMFAVGIGGSTTGKAADILIIDDPFKDMQQAYSQSQRARVREWYNSVAQTRLSLNGHIILMHTRWHENDLAGSLLEDSKADPKQAQWEVISMPAIGNENSPYRYHADKRKDGEPLWPSFKGDSEHLDKIRRSVGEKVWSALYQQMPTIEGGNIIKEQWIQLYSVLPFSLEQIPSNRLVQSWDLTFKETGTSYVVGVTIVNWQASFYIIDFYRGKADIIKSIEAIKAMTAKYPLSTVLIEDKANGPAVISMLKNQISRIIAIKPDASKDERLHVVAPLFEAKNVYLPANAPWTKTVINELQSFPNAANDDIVDAVSQGLQHWNKLSGLRRLEAMGNI